MNSKCFEDLVTVVVPVYNVERYLDRCINSIVNQTYKNLEILLIDDGSLDNCPKMCDEWAKKDSRVKVIHKENNGLGMARNTGIDNAHGKYICFIDSDDYYILEAVQCMIDSAEENSSDIVLFGFEQVRSDGSISRSVIPDTNTRKFSGKNVTEVILPNLFGNMGIAEKKLNIWGSAWACLYSKDIIDRCNWRFVSERDYISEDVYSLLILYSNISTVSIVCKALYMYCENDQSLSRTYRSDRIIKIMKWYDSCKKICSLYLYPNTVLVSVQNMLFSNIIGALKSCCKSSKTNREGIKRINSIINDNEFQDVVREIDKTTETIKRRVLLYFIKKRRPVMVYYLCR